VDEVICGKVGFHLFLKRFSHDIEILITLSYGKRCVRSQEFMAEDLGQEDVVGLVSWFKLVAADSSVGVAQVARFPGFVQRAESGGNVLRELRTGGGLDGVGAREGFEIPESVEGLDDLFLDRPGPGSGKARSLCRERGGF